MVKIKKNNQKGQSLVELALSATVMLFLMLAAIDFGFAFLYWITIRDAAQEGAMYGSLHPDPLCDAHAISAVVTASDSTAVRIHDIANPLLPDSRTSVSITRTGTNPGDTYTVNVSYLYPILTPLVGNVIGPTITISSGVSNTILQFDNCQ